MMAPGKEEETIKHVDLLIVGFGCAGSSAAMHAVQAMEEEEEEEEGKRRNNKILVVDRFQGGGATVRSGGIVYFGGGTDVQKHLGVKDDAENMFEYLKAEVGGSVSDATLWRFCASSAETAAWLRDSFGVKINDPDDTAVLCPFKTSNAPDKYSLFYSGSETCAPFNDLATPAARGHKAVGPGNLVGTGNVLFQAMEKAVRGLDTRGVEVQTQTKVAELLFEGERVAGARLVTLKHAPGWVRKLHRALDTYGGLTNPFNMLDSTVKKAIESLEKKWGRSQIVYASKGVLLATGGFCRNKERVKEHVPAYQGTMPIGSAGDTGSGIFELGVAQAGAATCHIDKGSLWKFIVPAASMAKSVAVDPSGRRIINEDVYGARLASAIGKSGKGKGWLIMDQDIWDQCRSEMGPESEMLLFQKGFTALNLYWNRTKADTLEQLAQATGMDEDILKSTLEEYNKHARSQRDPHFGKAKHLVQPLQRGPFYAIDASYRGTLWPSPFMTLGGLKVDEKTGAVISTLGKAIPGLFAAGRVASGVCSKSYVSGLSLADCIFAGRRAAEYAIRGKIYARQYSI